jgi:lipid A ethanolaminephosphotransferase
MPPIKTASHFLPARPQLSSYMLALLVAAFILITDNATYWTHVVTVFPGHWLSILTFGGIAFAIILFSLSLLGLPYIQKPILAFLLILSAVTAYYQDVLGVVIDRDMIQNAANTTTTEAKHLITTGFLLRVLVFGILPAALVFWVRLRPAPLWRSLLAWLLTWTGAFALFLACVFSDFRTNGAVIREHQELSWSIQPGSPLAGAFSYLKMMLRARNVVVEPLGLDATKGPRLAAAKKPVLTVFVVGETARAANFSLGGYARDTNPALRARNVIYFTEATSCGTATAISLPCMFSNLTRSGYSYQAAKSVENVLGVLHHAKIETRWYDNNSLSLGQTDRFKSDSQSTEKDPVACAKGECTDAILLPPLQDLINSMTEDTVVVLHSMGSHGPSYYLRYPNDFEPFKPACQTAQFADCSNEQIINAYDNSIAYTDKFLGDVIDLLKAQDKVIPAMLYVSDHGESLGENGIYLHAAPYFMAPVEQTHVPLLIWLSEAYKTTFAIDETCIRAKTALPASHDNIFHTLLGLMNITTTVRNDALDLIAGCQK